jgi:hypothetical protein
MRGTPVVFVGKQEPGMTAEQRATAIEASAEHDGRERAERHAVAADRYFDAEHPVGVTAFFNAMLREAWREKHGDVRRWDRVARASGVYTIGRVIVGRRDFEAPV